MRRNKILLLFAHVSKAFKFESTIFPSIIEPLGKTRSREKKHFLFDIEAIVVIPSLLRYFSVVMNLTPSFCQSTNKFLLIVDNFPHSFNSPNRRTQYSSSGHALGRAARDLERTIGAILDASSREKKERERETCAIAVY